LRADALDLLSQVQPARVAAYDLSAQALMAIALSVISTNRAWYQ